MIDQDDLRAAYPRATGPWTRLMTIASLDGAATRDGVSAPLGTAEDLLLMRTLRELTDVVVVGAATVAAEGYGDLGLDEAAQERRCRAGLPPLPRLAVVSGSLSIDPDAECLGAGPEPLVLTTAAASAERRRAVAEVAEVVDCGDEELGVPLLLHALHDRGLTQVLCEGGPRLAGAFIAADAVDELCLSISPSLEGGDAGRVTRSPSATPRRMRLGHVIPAGDLLLVRYVRDRGDGGGL